MNPKNKMLKSPIGIPKILVGKYAGTPIDQLPHSYLRWMITQDFPKDWLVIAKKKLESSKYSNYNLNISRHTLDMYSLRFLKRWVEYNEKINDPKKKLGLGTFVAKEAEYAWENGEDKSKNRHDRDGIVKEEDGIKWVFSLNTNFPDYKDVVTVMSGAADWDEDDYCGGCSRPLDFCKCAE